MENSKHGLRESAHNQTQINTGATKTVGASL